MNLLLVLVESPCLQANDVPRCGGYSIPLTNQKEVHKGLIKEVQKDVGHAQGLGKEGRHEKVMKVKV